MNKIEQIEQFLEHVEPNFEGGTFTWVKVMNSRTKVGELVNQFTTNLGYHMVGFRYKGKLERLLSHRILFYAYHGYLPDVIDHKDQNRLNNSIVNLRAATKSQNAINARIRVNNKSGVTGVDWHKGSQKWRSQIKVLGETKHLGTFTEKEDAIKARKEAEEKYFEEFSTENLNL